MLARNPAEVRRRTDMDREIKDVLIGRYWEWG